jgi:opacity protein-like surface antigen
LTRAFLFCAVLAAAAATSAAAAVGVPWTVLTTGTTTPSGAQQPVGYVAVTKAQEAQFASRLAAGDRADLARVNLVNTGLIAVFLDGMPCGSHLTVNHVVRTATTATVTLHWTKPPIGVAMCVRTSTPYVVVGVRRASFGHPAPTHVKVVAIARS